MKDNIDWFSHAKEQSMRWFYLLPASPMWCKVLVGAVLMAWLWSIVRAVLEWRTDGRHICDDSTETIRL